MDGAEPEAWLKARQSLAQVAPVYGQPLFPAAAAAAAVAAAQQHQQQVYPYPGHGLVADCVSC